MIEYFNHFHNPYIKMNQDSSQIDVLLVLFIVL